jgi:hypothetical protein
MGLSRTAAPVIHGTDWPLGSEPFRAAAQLASERTSGPSP